MSSRSPSPRDVSFLNVPHQISSVSPCSRSWRSPLASRTNPFPTRLSSQSSSSFTFDRNDGATPDNVLFASFINRELFFLFSFYKSNYVQRFHYSRPVRKGPVDPNNEFAVSLLRAVFILTKHKPGSTRFPLLGNNRIVIERGRRHNYVIRYQIVFLGLR